MIPDGDAVVGTADGAWDATMRQRFRASGVRRRRILTEPGRRGGAPLWSVTQWLHAGLLLRRAGARVEGLEDVAATLPRYRLGPAYAAVPGGRERFFDDNGWLALADEAARRLLRTPLLADLDRLGVDDWLLSGQRPDGGVAWREGSPGVNAVSTAAVGLGLARRCERQPQRVLLTAVDAAALFLRDTLVDASGAIRDRVRDDGSIEPTVWSYNQGTAVALEVARHRLGSPDALAQARRYAAAGLARFDGEPGWAQPAAFHGIWCRGLGQLAAVDDDPRWLAHVRAYAGRLLGLPGLSAGDLGAAPTGPGRYQADRSEADRSDVVDLAGALQALAVAVCPAEALPDLC